MTKLLNSVWKGTFTIGGIVLRCHVLEDGQRIIEAEDVEKLFEAMGNKNFKINDGDMKAFAKWQKGRS